MSETVDSSGGSRERAITLIAELICDFMEEEQQSAPASQVAVSTSLSSSENLKGNLA